ncbi:hypothetical protein FGO68_gene17018 [Halteria grandinella]|uniref:Uncharacterized protein n=1 Tax=Halteria grandinella TaxID=5974 RepID=A0A8J8NWA9_HALGN|nr:hypothetical protein FGO68_gene17018 [Halteria grandinella]
MWKRYKVVTHPKREVIISSEMALLCPGITNYIIITHFSNINPSLLSAASKYHHKNIVFEKVFMNNYGVSEDLRDFNIKGIIFIHEPPQSIKMLPSSLQMLTLCKIEGEYLSDMPIGRKLKIANVEIGFSSIKSKVMDSLKQIEPTQSLLIRKNVSAFNLEEYEAIFDLFPSTPKIIFDYSLCTKGERLLQTADYHYFQTKLLNSKKRVWISVNSFSDAEYEQLTIDQDLFHLFISYYHQDSQLIWTKSDSIGFFSLFIRVPAKRKQIRLYEFSKELCQCPEGTVEEDCPLIDRVCEEAEIHQNQEFRIRIHMKALKVKRIYLWTWGISLAQSLQQMPDAEEIYIDMHYYLCPEDFPLLCENKFLTKIQLNYLHPLDLPTIKQLCANKKAPFLLKGWLKKDIKIKNFIECINSKEMQGKVFDDCSKIKQFSQLDVERVLKGEYLDNNGAQIK